MLDKRFTYSNYTALFLTLVHPHPARTGDAQLPAGAVALLGWTGEEVEEWALRRHRLLLYDQMKVGLTTIEQESEVSSSFIIQNPKRNRNTHRSRASWYPYYAGFSPYFAQSLLALSGLNQTACIGDPWNGSGTTTTSAAMLGHRAYGYDLNPVMVIVAKARLLSQQETHLIWPITTNILQESKDDGATEIVEDDPLCTWLAPQSAASIRQLDRALQHLLVENAVPSRLGVNLNVSKLTSLAAFFYTALRTVRTVLKPFYASNPTWMKQPHNKDARLQFPLETILNIFHHEIGSMVIAITRDPYTTDACNGEMHIAVASSDALPVQNGMIDLILSSPPYCTRIDYAVATMPELAVLGYALQGTFQELRRQLIGTSMVPTSVPEPSLAWGTTCNTFLEQLVHHKSKASKLTTTKTISNILMQSTDHLQNCIAYSSRTGDAFSSSRIHTIRIFTTISHKFLLRWQVPMACNWLIELTLAYGGPWRAFIRWFDDIGKILARLRVCSALSMRHTKGV